MEKTAQQVMFLKEKFLARDISNLSDKNYAEVLSGFSQVHELLRNSPEMTVKDACSETFGDKTYANVFSRYITAYIGEANFRNNNFESISSVLDSFRPSAVSQPVEEVEPVVEEQPEVQEPSEEEFEEYDEDELDEFVGLKIPDFKDRIDAAKTVEYPESQKESVDLSFKNIQINLEKMFSSETQEDIDEFANLIESTLGHLEDLSNMQDEEEPEDNIIFNSPGKHSGGPKDYKDKKEQRELNELIVAKIDMNSFNVHPIVNGIELIPAEGITIENVPAIISSLKEVANRAKKQFEKFNEVTDRIHKDVYRFLIENKKADRVPLKIKGVDKGIQTDYNNLMYALKAVDKTVKRAMYTAPDDAETTTAINTLEPYLMQSVFTGDKAYFDEKILMTLAHFGVPDVGLLYGGIIQWKHLGRKTKAVSNLYTEYLKDYGKGRDLKADTEAQIGKSLWSKFCEIFQEDYADISIRTSGSMKNFIANSRMTVSYMSRTLRRNLRRGTESQDLGGVNLIKCPTCLRPVKWSGKVMENYNVFQSNGGMVPYFSFIRRKVNQETGKVSSGIITNEMLRNEGPYPPPDPSKLGYSSDYKPNSRGKFTNTARLYIKTRDTISKYEGNKTWDEILEMISSNDPLLHEEGIHRRAAALEHIGAVPLTHSKEVDGKKLSRRRIFKNIRSSMFSCPFSPDETSSKSGSGKLELKEKLEKSRNFDYPDDPESQELVSQSFETLNSLLEKLEDKDIEGDEQTELVDQINSVFEDLFELAGVSIETGESKFEKKREFSTSGCGLKLIPSENDPSSMIYSANAKPKAVKYSWQPEGFSPEQEKIAKDKMAGGYKFSKRFFRCPAILSGSASDLKKSKQIAISKAGMVGNLNGPYQPPIDPESYAQNATLEDGTISYLICGAPTSISSFDKSTSGHGSVYTVFKKLVDTMLGKSSTGQPVSKAQRKAAVAVVEFLILEGIDYNDVITALEIADKLEKGKETTASLIQSRIKNLEKMLVYAMNKMPSELEQIEELVLVCPHGHKFEIGQSIRFGESHSSLMMTSINRSYSIGTELFNHKGMDNLKAAKKTGLIVPASDYEELTLYGSESFDSSDLSKLCFMLPDKDNVMKKWKFAPNVLSIIATNAFSSATHTNYHRMNLESVEYAKVSFGGELFADIVKNADTDGADAATIAMDMMTAAEDSSSSNESFEALARPIEGFGNDISENVEALGRALKSVLKIIITWSNRAVDTHFFNQIVKKSDFKVEGIADKILAIGGFFYEEEEIPKEAWPIIKQGIETRLKTYIISTSGFQAKEPITSAASLISAAMVDAVEQLAQDTEYEIELDYETTAFDFVYEKVLPMFEPYKEEVASMEKIFALNNEAYIKMVEDQIKDDPISTIIYRIGSYTRTDDKKKLREIYGQKIFLVSYARYLANSISILYNECMVENRSVSGSYIGYDIGVDLSSTEKILNLKAEELRRVVVEKYDRDFKDQNKFIVLKNIRKAYNSIVGKMSVARDMSITPIALAKAKQTLLSKAGGSNDPVAHATFSAAFPLSTHSFSKQSLAYAPTNIPNPFGMKKGVGVVLPDLHQPEEGAEPGVLPPAMITLMNDNGTPVVDSKTGLEKKVPVYIHPDSNFDSSKFQIGMVRGKTEDNVRWPLNNADNFVGIPLPISRYRKNMSKDFSGAVYTAMKNLPVYDYRFVIDIDGKPQDISFLIRRGRNDEQSNQLKSYYYKIDQLEKERANNLEIARSEEEMSQIDNYYDAAIREIYSLIKTVPMKIETGSTFVAERKKVGDKQKWDNENHPVALLVSPKEAFNLINNLERFEVGGMIVGEPDSERLTHFISKVYGLDLIRDIIVEVYSKNGIQKDLKTEDIFNINLDPNNPEENKILKEIASSVKKNYPQHLGTYFDILPNGTNGQGSHITIVENSVPKFKLRRGMKHAEVYPESSLESPPSMSVLAVKTGRTKVESDYFGVFKKNSEGEKYLTSVQESMLEYVRASTRGELGQNITEAKHNSEYIKKIAKRRRFLERTILTMGEADVDVEDLLDI